MNARDIILGQVQGILKFEKVDLLQNCLSQEIHLKIGKMVPFSVGKPTHDSTVTAVDYKTTVSGGDNRKQFPLGAALQVPQNFPFALV